MRNGVKWLLFPATVAALVLATRPALADQVIYFLNGKAIIVKSAEKQDKFTILEMEGGGKIGVPTEQIARIEEYQANVPPPQSVAAAPPPVPVTSPIAAAQAAAPGAVPPPAPQQAAGLPVPGGPPPQRAVPGAASPGVATPAGTSPTAQSAAAIGQGAAPRAGAQPRAGVQSGAYGGPRFNNARGGPMLSLGAGAGGRGNPGGRSTMRPRADRLGPRGSQVGAPPADPRSAVPPDADAEEPAVEQPAPPPDTAPEETAPASDEPSTEPEAAEEPAPDAPPEEPQED